MGKEVMESDVWVGWSGYPQTYIRNTEGNLERHELKCSDEWHEVSMTTYYVEATIKLSYHLALPRPK